MGPGPRWVPSPGKFSHSTSTGVARLVSPIFWYLSFSVSAWGGERGQGEQWGAAGGGGDTAGYEQPPALYLQALPGKAPTEEVHKHVA